MSSHRLSPAQAAASKAQDSSRITSHCLGPAQAASPAGRRPPAFFCLRTIHTVHESAVCSLHRLFSSQRCRPHIPPLRVGGMNRTSDLPAEKTDLANPDLGPQVWISLTQGLDCDQIQTLQIQTSDFQIRTSDLGLEKADLGLDFFPEQKPNSDLALTWVWKKRTWVWKKWTLQITKIQTSDLGLEKTDLANHENPDLDLGLDFTDPRSGFFVQRSDLKVRGLNHSPHPGQW